jgi:hypothetical protein
MGSYKSGVHSLTPTFCAPQWPHLAFTCHLKRKHCMARNRFKEKKGDRRNAIHKLVGMNFVKPVG